MSHGLQHGAVMFEHLLMVCNSLQNLLLGQLLLSRFGLLVLLLLACLDCLAALAE